MIPPIVPIRSRMNEGYTLPSYLFNTHVNIILPSTLTSGMFPSGFTTKGLYTLLFFPVGDVYLTLLDLATWMINKNRGPFTGAKATVASKLTIHQIHCVVKNAWSFISTYSLIVIAWLFGKYRSNFVHTDMRRTAGRPELWYKVGRKLRNQTSTFVFWPISFVFINWITTLNVPTQVQVLQKTKGCYCFLSITHPILYLFARCICQPLIFTTVGFSINTLYDSAGSVIHRGH
jgi:hypothetical protein